MAGEVLSLPLTGALADKVDRKTLMIGLDIGRSLCMFGLVFTGSHAMFWLSEVGSSLIGEAYWTIVLLLAVDAFHLGGQGMGFAGVDRN